MFGFGKKKDETDQKATERQAKKNVNDKEIKRLVNLISEYEAEKRALYGELDHCKEKLTEIEKQLETKFREYELATGARKNIVKREYATIAKDYELKKGKSEIIQSKIDQCTALIVGAEQSIQFLRGASVREDAETLAEVHVEGARTLHEDGVAVKELEGELVQESKDEAFDIEAHFAELTGESSKKKDESVLKDKAVDESAGCEETSPLNKPLSRTSLLKTSLPGAIFDLDD